MKWLLNPVLFLLVISSPTLIYGQDELSVEIVNPGGATGSGDRLHLIYEQVEVVICQITNADKIPDVTFGFVNDTAFPVTNVTTDARTEADNKYDVNVTITFKVSGKMNMNYLSCSFDGQEWKALLDLYFPPLVSVYGSGQVPNYKDNKDEMYCLTISVPKTRFEWKVNGIPIDDTNLTYTQEHDCKQEYNTNYASDSYKFNCRTNLTLVDLRKEDIGSNVTCSSIYEGETRYIHDVKTLNYQYNPDSIAVVAKPTQVVRGSVNGTMELTCTTAPGNPQPTPLNWYRGSSQYDNRLNMSQYPVTDTDTGMYKGHITEQTVELSVNKELNGETYLCCVNGLVEYFTLICGATDIQVPWLSDILAPQLEEYTVYVGSNLSILCTVDSNPAPSVSWLDKDGQTIINGSNNLELSLVNAKKTDSGKYECKARLNVDGPSNSLEEVSKMITVNVVDAPDKPQVSLVGFNEQGPTIEINTPSTAPLVPQAFYIQYKKSTESVWVEISKSFSDTLPGQTSQRYMFDMSSLDLPSGDYQVRVKALSQTGQTMYTDAQTFKVQQDEEMVEKKDVTTAILVSVFVTAAVFIIILVVVVCLLKRSSGGKWNVR